MNVDSIYAMVQSNRLTYSMIWKAPIPFLSRRVGFPSWSWCGWIGGITTNSEIRDAAKWTRRFLWIHWYLFDNEKNHFHLLPQQDWLPENTERDSDDDVIEIYGDLLKQIT